MKNNTKNIGLIYKKGTQVKILRGDHKSKKGTIISYHNSKIICEQIVGLKSKRAPYQIKIDVSKCKIQK